MLLNYWVDSPFERNELLPSFSLKVLAVGAILGGRNFTVIHVLIGMEKNRIFLSVRCLGTQH